MFYFVKFIGQTVGNIFITLIHLIIAPFFTLLANFLPNINQYFGYIYEFLHEHVFPPLQFAKMVFLNMTGISIPVFTILVASLGFLITFSVQFLIVKFAYNLYQIVTGNKRGST